MNGAILDLTPNELAEQLTGRSYISYSAITTFQQCPLKYRFKYIDQLPEAAVSASLVFGGAIHSAFEFHFNELMAGKAAPNLDSLQCKFQEAWQSRDNDNIQFGKSEDVDSLNQLAQRASLLKLSRFSGILVLSLLSLF